MFYSPSPVLGLRNPACVLYSEGLMPWMAATWDSPGPAHVATAVGVTTEEIDSIF